MKKEFITYCLVGFSTTIFHIILFATLNLFLEYYIANIITLVITKILAYILNKVIVFKTKSNNKKELAGEITRYTISRAFTFLLDYFGLIFLVETLSMHELLGKIIVVVVVIVINYILSTTYVYRKSERSNHD